MTEPAAPPTPASSPCSNCLAPRLPESELCPACGWTPSGPSASLLASARRWGIGLGWWGIACAILLFAVGLITVETGQKSAGVVLMTWAAIYGVGVLAAVYRRAAALLVLAVHATVCAVVSFIAISKAVTVEQSRQVGIAALIYLLNAVLFVVGAVRAGRAEKGGTSLLRPWLAAILPLLLGLMLGISQRPDLFAISVTVATLGATIAGWNIVRGGDRGFRLPARPAADLALAVGLAVSVWGVAWAYNHWLAGVFGPQILSLNPILDQMPAGLKLACLVILVPACEEILFRGAIHGRLRAGWDSWTAIAAGAAMFALIHLSPLGFPWLLVLGAALGFARERSGSLLPGFVIHAAVNAGMLFGPSYLSRL